MIPPPRTRHAILSSICRSSFWNPAENSIRAVSKKRGSGFRRESLRPCASQSSGSLPRCIFRFRGALLFLRAPPERPHYNVVIISALFYECFSHGCNNLALASAEERLLRRRLQARGCRGSPASIG